MRADVVREAYRRAGVPVSGPAAWDRLREQLRPSPEIEAALAIARTPRNRSRAFALMAAYVGREPTAMMKTVLAQELPDADKWTIPLAAAFLAHHKRRLDTRALAEKSKEDVAKMRAGFKVHGGHAFALDALRRGGDPDQGQAQSRDEILTHFVRVERAEDPAATWEEIRRRAGNRVRRQSRRETVVPPGPKTAAKLAASLDGDEARELAAFVERESLRGDAAQASLSESERETFLLLLDGLTVTEAAHRRDRSRSQISEEKSRALDKIREHRQAAGQ